MPRARARKRRAATRTGQAIKDALRQERRRVFAEVTQGAGRAGAAGTAVAGTGAGIGGEAGVVGAAGAGGGGVAEAGWFGKMMGKARKHPVASTAIGSIAGVILLDALMKQITGIIGQSQEAGLAGQSLDIQAGAATPEAARERAMAPITKARRDAALMMLMKQLGSAGGIELPTMLAEGEVLT